MIDKFVGEYRFLSNFYIVNVEYGGLTFTSSEAAFQASKSLDYCVRKEFEGLSPGKAKKKGKSIALRSDWDSVKYNIMLNIVYNKFAQNEDIAIKLLDTGDEYLAEGNTWGDRVWGVVDGEGNNWLGKILMHVRDMLRKNSRFNKYEGERRVQDIIYSLSESERDIVYRILWTNHVVEDVRKYIAGMRLKASEESIKRIAKRYVYDGDYDCDKSYWSNIENLINDELR